MAPDLSKFNKNGSANPEAITEALTAAEKAFGRSLPADYMSFMRETDGGEGIVGDNYLELWRAGELVEFNNDYVVEEFAPGLLLFGGDGGNELYAFDTRQESMPVVIVPGIGMSLENAAPVADSFEGLLARLAVDGPFDESDEDEDEDNDDDDMNQENASFTPNGPGDAGALTEAETSFGAPFPAEYRKFMEAQDGGEGFVGEDYLILWRAGELARLNEAYEVKEYAPGLLLFGSNGCGDAYAFDTNDDSAPVVSVPFVGMRLEDTELMGDSFEDFLSSFDDEDEPPSGEPIPKDMETFLIQPLVLGGDPDDPENETQLPREKHIEAVRYWNRIVSDMRKQG